MGGQLSGTIEGSVPPFSCLFNLLCSDNCGEYAGIAYCYNHKQLRAKQGKHRSSITSVRLGGLSKNADTVDAFEGVGGLSQNAVIQTLRREGVGEFKHRASIAV